MCKYNVQLLHYCQCSDLLAFFLSFSRLGFQHSFISEMIKSYMVSGSYRHVVVMFVDPLGAHLFKMYFWSSSRWFPRLAKTN